MGALRSVLTNKLKGENGEISLLIASELEAISGLRG
jgi:hypothetical protein